MSTPESVPERKPITLRSDLIDRMDMLIEFSTNQGATGVSLESLVDAAVEGFLSGISEGIAEGEI